jgi:hypothetical protein
MKEAIKWESLTKKQQDEFTMYGNVEKIDWFFSDLDTAVKPNLYNTETVEEYLRLIKRGSQGDSYGWTDTWLYSVLGRHNIKGQRVAIVGSIKPWYESICLYYEGIPITLEYNVIVPFDKRLRMIHIKDAVNEPLFDAAISISTFEHDGLGRYGDPIDPDGDFRAMKELKNIIKKDGLLFLAVPVGKDKLVWNAHRKYGELRLPYLIDNWEMIDQEGFDEQMFQMDSGESGAYQPIFVLKNI